MIKRALWIGLILFCSLLLPATAAPSFIPKDIEQLLALPEGKLDVGIAALTFAKEIYPTLDVGAYSRKIDALADKARHLANGTQDPEQRIRILNTVLFRREGFRYDRDPFSRSKQAYYFLNGILDTKLGLCYTLPLLYIAVAQRMGYPVYPVAAPDHLFVRYVDPAFKQQNIETTSGGKYFDDETYIRDFAISRKGLASGSYLRTMSYREFLGDMLAANAMVHFRTDGNKGLAYLEMARQLNPKFAVHYQNLGEAYLAASQVTPLGVAGKYRALSEQFLKQANELGYVSETEISNARRVRGK